MRPGSPAVPVTRTGRLWGTSANSAPRVSTISTLAHCATSITSEQNVRHRSWGSVPRTTMTSRPSGVRPARNSLDGQVISRAVPTCATVGRVEEKSKNCSGSMLANRRAPQRSDRCRTARLAASPASFHPSNAATSTGRLSTGRSESGLSHKSSSCALMADHASRDECESTPPRDFGRPRVINPEEN